MKLGRAILSCVLVELLRGASRARGEEEDEVYRGKYLGKINSYHHQVSGDVYAVDEYTLLLVQFNYDGNAADAFFWAGAANRPGPEGFIVPDEYGKTNVLARYFNKDFTLSLPDRKRITEIKWLAVYDLASQNTLGDLYIPEEFEPPIPQKISQLTTRSDHVSSDSVEILDAKTLRIVQFSYDGRGKDTYFWVGVGPQPSSKGSKVPDEYGYLDPIRSYSGEDVTLELPGQLTIFNIDWFSVFDAATKENYASVIIPDGLNVPPSLVKVFPHTTTLPNCVQLHKDLQVAWEVFGPQITIQLSGQVGEDDYMAFGLSGSTTKSEVVGSDVTVAYVDGVRGYAVDYNVTAKTPCSKVLGQYKGVCKDELLGGIDNNQMHTAVRDNGISVITYRRSLISSDPGDKEYVTEGLSYVVWAVGRLSHNKEPMFHDLYPKADLQLELNRKDGGSDCVAFTRSTRNSTGPWKRAEIFDRSVRTFTATVGPSGGRRGYQGITGMTTTGLVWYINGLLAPELWLRRGLTYSFRVLGGNNPHSAEYYHPLIVTDEPHGALEALGEEAQRRVRVLAGVEYTRRGQPKPTAAGPLCLSKHNGRDRRLDDAFPDFRKFNRSLTFTCEEGKAARLEVTPNTTWPDVVYYNSFTHPNMGWKIHIVDSYAKVAPSSAFAPRLAAVLPVVAAVFHLLGRA
ncbi:LOW QUALITY PROTEIN: protein Skeletor, isoforms B/C-like [Bacillus rossius redtenbacheri]|uniref:LOW QUALITY PROTEIN: protein Skeletor, isoforms B/C-like n=1 Tax=Bacillus rossius redtenbacheri TaxID=93214 RepID=UPI002FDE4EEF